jgi:hypothetical protein
MYGQYWVNMMEIKSPLAYLLYLIVANFDMLIKREAVMQREILLVIIVSDRVSLL